MIKKQIKLKNNETLNVLLSEKKTKALLLIHGNTASSIFFEPLFAYLPKDTQVIIPDLRGFGDSSYQNRIDSISDLALDLKYLLDELKISKVAVLGWSLGGAVAMELATTYPDLVESLVLLSSSSLKGYPTFKKDAKGQVLFPQIYSSREELASDFVQIIPLLEAYKNKNIAYLEMIYNMVIYTGKVKPDHETNVRWFNDTIKQRNLVDVNWSLANFNISSSPNFYTQGNNKISLLKAKTLLIWGDKDITVPRYMLDENINNIKDAKTIIYEGAGHSIIVDEPEKLVKDIINFI